MEAYTVKADIVLDIIDFQNEQKWNSATKSYIGTPL